MIDQFQGVLKYTSSNGGKSDGCIVLAPAGAIVVQSTFAIQNRIVPVIVKSLELVANSWIARECINPSLPTISPSSDLGTSCSPSELTALEVAGKRKVLVVPFPQKIGNLLVTLRLPGGSYFWICVYVIVCPWLKEKLSTLASIILPSGQFSSSS